MDGKAHGLLKERTKAKEMKAKQELGIGSKAQESGSLCDAFLLFRDLVECFFLLFSVFEPGGRKAEMCGDR